MIGIALNFYRLLWEKTSILVILSIPITNMQSLLSYFFFDFIHQGFVVFHLLRKTIEVLYMFY